ncbi:MAG: multidrug effflux MFS transporter [Rhizobiales bacterium]|nr:multidrug effflux MFS transporter [Hyphomicrobiales bacterium]
MPMRSPPPLPGVSEPLRAPPRRPPVLALIAISALSPFAINVVVPSMPAIEQAFDADYSRVQLILSMFLAAIAISQIFVGPLSDRFGRRPILLIGFTIFVAASLLAPFAPTIEALIGIRVIQGAAGCVGIALGRAIVRDLFDRSQAASMLGYVTMGLAMAPMVAPTIGGLLQESLGWTAIFWLMAALGGLCLLVTWRLIPETNFRRTAALSLRSLFADFGQLLRRRDFLLFTGSSSLTTGVFFTFLGGAPYVAERILGLRPSVYGLWFALLPLGYALGSFLAARFTERFGVSRMILAGSSLALLAVATLLVLSLAGFSGPAALFVPMGVAGMANGLALPSAVSGAVSVRPEIAGAASGLSGAAQIGMGAILSAVGGAALAASSSALPMFVIMTVAAVLALFVALAIGRRNQPRGA